jgi:hypothetical protein
LKVLPLVRLETELTANQAHVGSALQQLSDVRVFLPARVIMPRVILHALKGEEHTCAPDAIPERKSEDDHGVKVLVGVAAIKSTPVRGGDLLYAKSSGVGLP